MDYNTSRDKLLLPEYGRLVQQMMEEAKKMEDKRERQAFAQVIVRIMASMSPDAKPTADFEHKLWDHLAYISNYELDIDYPFEITTQGIHPKPQPVAYPKRQVKLRHYGSITENWIATIAELPEGQEREQLTYLIANRMKKSLVEWKGAGISDEKIARDLAHYTDGKLEPDFSVHRLAPVAQTSTGKKK